MVFVTKAQVPVEELKMFSQADNHQALLTTLDNLYMVQSVMHPDFEHICDQILMGQQSP